MRARLVDDDPRPPNDALLASWSGHVRKAWWQTLRFNFTSRVSARSASLHVSGTCQPPQPLTGLGRRSTTACNASFWIGAVSLMPCDNVHGARADVLKLLTDLNFRGPLRWPGGCFSSISPHWREALLPPDERPPVHNPPAPFCDAVRHGQVWATQRQPPSPARDARIFALTSDTPWPCVVCLH